MLGVTIGIILLILLIGLVVLQALIEWGGLDTGKIIKKNQEKSDPEKKVIVKSAKKIKRKGKK